MIAHGVIRLPHRTESTPASCSGCCTLSTELIIFQDPILCSRNYFPLKGRKKGEQREERRHPKMKSY